MSENEAVVPQDQETMMRVMVTGGAGYIGSVVNEELLSAGHSVVVFDNLAKGHVDAAPPGVPLIKANLMDREALQQALMQHKIEAVVHMAAYSLVGESVTNPAEYYRNNFVAGLSLLDCMRASGVDLIVFSSTAAVYGEPAKQPITETDPTAPVNPYGETKLAFEQALHWHSLAYKMKYVSLRYFNAAGASERCGEWHNPETHLIPLVLQAALGRNANLQLYGDDYPTRDGTCLRDYIHVTYLANAHVKALEAMGDSSFPAENIFNLGCGGDGYTVREVIDTARRITGRYIPVQIGPRRSGETRHTAAARTS